MSMLSYLSKQLLKGKGSGGNLYGQCLQIMPQLHSNAKLEKEIETKQTVFHGQNSKHHLHQAGKYQVGVQLINTLLELLRYYTT